MQSALRPRKTWQQEGPTFPMCLFNINRKISGTQSGITSRDDQQFDRSSLVIGCDGNIWAVPNTVILIHTTGKRKNNMLIHILKRELEWVIEFYGWYESNSSQWLDLYKMKTNVKILSCKLWTIFCEFKVGTFGMTPNKGWQFVKFFLFVGNSLYLFHSS